MNEPFFDFDIIEINPEIKVPEIVFNYIEKLEEILGEFKKIDYSYEEFDVRFVFSKATIIFDFNGIAIKTKDYDILKEEKIRRVLEILQEMSRGVRKELTKKKLKS